MKTQFFVLALTLQTTFAFGAYVRSFSCESVTTKTTLEVTLQGSIQLESGTVQLTKTEGRPAKTTTESFRIARTNMKPYVGKGVEFVEVSSGNTYYEWNQSTVRSLILPTRLFTSRPYRQFEVILGDLDPEAGRAQVEYFKCQLN